MVMCHYWVRRASAPGIETTNGASSIKATHCSSDSSGTQRPPHLSDFCLCLAFPFKICSRSPRWWLVTMETTIRLFCSMSRKIAKCRQQPPLTYQTPNPSSSICSFRTFKKMLLKLPGRKHQFLFVHIPSSLQFCVLVNSDENTLEK